MGTPGLHPRPGLGNEPSTNAPFLQGRFNGDGAKSKPAFFSAIVSDGRQGDMTDDVSVLLGHE